MRQRWMRRMIGMLKARLPDAKLGAVRDPRRQHGLRWKLASILNLVVMGMIAGAKRLSDLEALTAEMSPDARRALAVKGRLPDTTARDVLTKLDPDEIREAIRRQVLAAYQRGALEPEELPFGFASLDGKTTMIRVWDDEYAQKQGSRGAVRTITATLVSSRARTCLDAAPIPPKTNEMGHYPVALEDLVDAYGNIDLFRAVMYDAGACSEENARRTRKLGVHYVMRLNDNQPTLLAEARRHLEQAAPEPQVVVEDGNIRYILYATEEMAGFLNWSHLKTSLLVRREVLDGSGRVTSWGMRYFITSLRCQALSPCQWVTVLRARWGVENNCHHTWDTVFQEDDRTWIETSPVAALVVILLRRVAYNLLTLFRSRTLRSEDGRLTPWRTLVRRTYNALIAATHHAVVGLRARKPPD